jgi:hypothetical protein
MYVARLYEIDNVPTLSAMVGSVGSQDVIDQINMRWGGASTVAFGQVTNPLNTGYQQFLNLVNGQLARTDNLVQQVAQSVIYPETWRTIDSEEALVLPPASMQVALLTTPGLFERFKDHQISGWGWDPDTFPDTDPYERALNNGKVETRPDPNDVPDEVVTEWSTDMTDYDLDNDEDYFALIRSRKFIVKLLNQELGPDGQRRDPTDLSQTMSV